jgi:hypothetical protein
MWVSKEDWCWLRLVERGVADMAPYAMFLVVLVIEMAYMINKINTCPKIC